MSRRRVIAAVPLVSCLITPLGWSGCTERPAEEAQAKAAPAPPAAELPSEDAGSADYSQPFVKMILPVLEIGPEWIVKTGKTDIRNRYSSAVEVYPKESGYPKLPDPAHPLKLCTGVVVSPRLVLTAAACLCSQEEEAQSDGGQQVVDARACAAAALVQSITYEPRADGGKPYARIGKYDGAVKVHPAFKQVFDEGGNAISTEANLAVIVLGQPAHVPPVELAESDVSTGESLVIAGYGFLPGPDDHHLWRHFSEHPVTKVLDSGGRVAFAQPPPFLYQGARGGPCLRQTEKRVRLAGILSASAGEEASFTSTYPYREWLRAEMAAAAEAGVTAPPDPPERVISP